MSSYLDGIPQAVATIVTAFQGRFGQPGEDINLDQIQKRVVDFTDQLTRTFAKALHDEEKVKP